MSKHFFVYILFILLCGDVNGQVPLTLSYQGLLTDTNGAPVSDGSHTILFNFYTAESGGTSIFNRGPIEATTFKGLFTIILGNGQGTNNAPLPANFGDTQYWIGVSPSGQAELAPRVLLTAVPYAFRAQYVSVVDGSNITSGTVPNARLDGNLQDLADGSLSGSKVGSGINASNITTGTLPAGVIPSTAGVPIGTVIAYAGGSVPSGWLECNGNAISRITYGSLFAAIGVTWGAGDASSTFNLPDLRGIFLRGWDHGSGNDVDRNSRYARFTSGAVGDNVGTYESDRMADHTHGQTTSDNAVTWSAAGGSGLFYGRAINSVISNNYLQTSGQNQSGNETRPKNAFVLYIIKAQ